MQALWKKLLLVCVIAFCVRAIVFYTYIQHEERYHQADSGDYHYCALFLAIGNGMIRADNQQPIFWRTPLYPWYLSWFYKAHRIKTGLFADYTAAHKASLWMQIAISSCIPLLFFFLALLLTQSMAIAWISTWISVFHVGFVLASTFLLTEALSLPFFMLFLFFFYKSFSLWGETPTRRINVYHIIIAALFLAGYTWIRPNGQFLAVVALIILLFAHGTWRTRLLHGCLVFAVVFWGALSPWYIRNHTLTGQWFYCPMFGPYVHAFCAPRALSAATGKSLDECLKVLNRVLHAKIMQTVQNAERVRSPLYISRELVSLDVALPIMKKYPWFVACDWMREVCNASFDMYANQLVRFANGGYQSDPPIEYLSVKYKDALYAQPMHWLMRLICWLDFLFTILLWVGLLAGCIQFLILPLLFGVQIKYVRRMIPLWIKTGMMVGGLLIMTGGYGYARLRLPVEPIMIIVSLTWWVWMFAKKKELYEA